MVTPPITIEPDDEAVEVAAATQAGTPEDTPKTCPALPIPSFDSVFVALA